MKTMLTICQVDGNSRPYESRPVHQTFPISEKQPFFVRLYTEVEPDEYVIAWESTYITLPPEDFLRQLASTPDVQTPNPPTSNAAPTKEQNMKKTRNKTGRRVVTAEQYKILCDVLVQRHVEQHAAILAQEDGPKLIVKKPCPACGGPREAK